MSPFNRQADALVMSFEQFDMADDPEVVVEHLRLERDLHPLADLIESLVDQRNELRVKLRRAERQNRKKRKN